MLSHQHVSTQPSLWVFKRTFPPKNPGTASNCEHANPVDTPTNQCFRVSEKLEGHLVALSSPHPHLDSVYGASTQQVFSFHSLTPFPGEGRTACSSLGCGSLGVRMSHGHSWG